MGKFITHACSARHYTSHVKIKWRNSIVDAKQGLQNSETKSNQDCLCNLILALLLFTAFLLQHILFTTLTHISHFLCTCPQQLSSPLDLNKAALYFVLVEHWGRSQRKDKNLFSLPMYSYSNEQ